MLCSSTGEMLASSGGAVGGGGAAALQVAELFRLSGWPQRVAKGQQSEVQPQKSDAIELVFLHLPFALFQPSQAVFEYQGLKALRVPGLVMLHRGGCKLGPGS